MDEAVAHEHWSMYMSNPTTLYYFITIPISHKFEDTQHTSNSTSHYSVFRVCVLQVKVMAETRDYDHFLELKSALEQRYERLRFAMPHSIHEDSVSYP